MNKPSNDIINNQNP